MNSPTGRLTWGSIPLELLGVTVLLVHSGLKIGVM